MSAIFGLVFTNPDRHCDHNDLAPLLDAMNHWKADDIGIATHGQTGLGHLMLWNTPESLKEKLPASYGFNGLTITADARIDNRDDLFKKLDIPFGEPHLIPDSLLILHSYRKYGKACVEHLLGDFAFAIWDEPNRELFCARDHMGVKPLFYYQDERMFVFASEKKGILAVSERAREVNETFLCLNAIHFVFKEQSFTLYKNIHRIMPAHSLVLKQGSITTRRYWELNIHHKIVYKKREQYLEDFREKFTRAIKLRLRSTNLIAAELSGGLDSSGITCIAANLLHAQNKKIATVSLAATSEVSINENGEDTDNELINAVLEFAKIDYPEVIRQSCFEHWMDEIDTHIKIFDGPQSIAAFWSIGLKNRAAQLNARVILSGQGGDDLATNFSRLYYLDDLAENRFLGYIKQAIKEMPVLSVVKTLIRHKAYFALKPLLYRRTLKNIKQQILGTTSLLNDNLLKKLLNEDVDKYIAIKFPKSFRDVQKSFLTEESNVRFENETLMGYHYRIEPRFPMIDVPLMEYVLALPANEKMSFETDRLLYRNAMKNLMPALVLDEMEYSGFSIPFARHQWDQVQTDKLRWINSLEKSGSIPHYLDIDKVKAGYYFNNKNNNNPRHLEVRSLAEIILKFCHNNC